MPRFKLFYKGQELGTIRRQFTFFKPTYDIDFNGWHIEGNWLGWDYSIYDSSGQVVATVSKDLMHLTDHYFIDVKNKEDALHALMVVLAIDADKCSQNNG